MSEPVIFPKNFDAHIRLGIAAYEAGDYETAIIEFELAYSIKQKKLIHSYLVKAYANSGQIDDAKRILLESVDNYLDDTKGVQLYLQLLLETGEFVKAHLVLAESVDKFPELYDIKEELRQLELNFKKYKRNEYIELLNSFDNLAHSSFMQQVSELKRAHYLPLNDYLELITPLLTHQNVHEIVRSSLLEELVILKKNKPIEYLWWNNQLRSVVPSQQTRILGSEVYNDIKDKLNEVLEHNPQLLYSVEKEIPLHFAIMYPFANEVILDVDNWIDTYLKFIKSSYSSDDIRNDLYNNHIYIQDRLLCMFG